MFKHRLWVFQKPILTEALRGSFPPSTHTGLLDTPACEASAAYWQPKCSRPKQAAPNACGSMQAVLAFPEELTIISYGRPQESHGNAITIFAFPEELPIMSHERPWEAHGNAITVFKRQENKAEALCRNEEHQAARNHTLPSRHHSDTLVRAYCTRPTPQYSLRTQP